MKEMILTGLLVLGPLSQGSATDSRNTNIPHTDTHFTMPVYKTRAEWEARIRHLRKQILSAAGLFPMPEKSPLNPQIFGRIENQDYSVEKVYLETFPGYYLGGNLYRPLNREGKFPAVATPHGHWAYGRLEHQPLVSAPARAINLARQGYVVFSYDMVGYNDTVQTPHVFGERREQLWSFGPLGLQLWNSIRVVDFLQSLPDVDPQRIAATGESGGGTQTFLLAAVDDRVKYSAPVNMISAIMQGGSPCENAPNLRLGTFNAEIAAMMAPRPMLMVSATGDWTKNTPREEYPAIRAIYELYGESNKLETIQIDAPHNYNGASREAVYRFFGKHILGETDSSKLTEKSIRVEKLQDMLVFHGRMLPAGALNFEQLFRQWIAAAEKQNAATSDRDALRERLAYSLGADWPAEVSAETNGDKVILTRIGKGDRVPGIWVRSGGPTVLVVHPAGVEAARSSAEVKALIRDKHSVLMIDAFQTGSAVAPRDTSTRHFLTFNQTVDANRVQDILTALAFIKQTGARDVRLLGIEDAAIWSLFAAAVAKTPVHLLSEPKDFNGRDDEFIKRFFVPGIQRAGGLRAALLLTRR